MEHKDFVHKKFRATTWESEIKDFIRNLEVAQNRIWYKDRELKKASEELITLGFYVKYKFGMTDSIEFYLNPLQGPADGWIFRAGNQIEAVQIVIAFYDKEEVEEDKQLMRSGEYTSVNWEGDRFKALAIRIEERIIKKVEKKYRNIDTLIVGVKDSFVRSILKNYPILKIQLEQKVKALLSSTQMKQLAIVDTDLVGKGEIWLFPNKLQIRSLIELVRKLCHSRIFHRESKCF